jgi:hypothetical protein
MKFTFSRLRDPLETTASVDEIAFAPTDSGLEQTVGRGSARRRAMAG